MLKLYFTLHVGALLESGQLEQKAPLFLKELYDIEAAEGDTVKFRCKVRAFPPPRVMWYKDGHRIDPSASYKIGSSINLLIQI